MNNFYFALVKKDVSRFFTEETYCKDLCFIKEDDKIRLKQLPLFALSWKYFLFD